MAEPSIAPFTGFPAVTFSFLRGIAAHNDKLWFEGHRADYQAGYVEPARSFVAAVGPELRRVSKAVSFDPRVNGSLFRINRDTRFSKDKSPYKTHLDVWFWEGAARGWESPGYFFRMFHDRLMLGAGMHGFGKEQLAVFRAAVVDDKRGAALERAIAAADKAGLSVGGATRAKVPRGMDPDHRRAKLLLHEGLWAGYEGRVPKEAKTAKLVDWCVERFAGAAPVVRWLQSAVLVA